MKLGPIIEIILYVEDMEKLVRFYRDTLGLRVTSPDPLPGWVDCHWVTFSTGQCTLALHSGGKRDFGKDAPKYVFLVEDVEQIRAELVSKGVTVQDVYAPAPGIKVCNIVDPEGNVFSIEEQSSAG